MSESFFNHIRCSPLGLQICVTLAVGQSDQIASTKRIDRWMDRRPIHAHSLGSIELQPGEETFSQSPLPSKPLHFGRTFPALVDVTLRSSQSRLRGGREIFWHGVGDTEVSMIFLPFFIKWLKWRNARRERKGLRSIGTKALRAFN